MAKIIHEAGGHPLINGVKFTPHAEGGWASEDVTDEQLAAFDGVPGFRVLEQEQHQSAQAQTKTSTNKGGRGKKAAPATDAPAEQPESPKDEVAQPEQPEDVHQEGADQAAAADKGLKA